MLGPEETVALIEEHGLVLESARGPLPRLVEQIVGEPIEGSWWGHASGRHIYAVLEQVRSREEVLVFRLVRGKLTYAHRRVWPALVVLADEIGPQRLAAVQDVHMPDGHHESVETPFPQWVPEQVQEEAEGLALADARAMIAPVL